MVIAALILLACSTEDGPEYDVFAGLIVTSAQLEINGDGTPLIMAQVAMFYGTRSKLRQYDPKYQLRNMETRIYTLKNGVWNSFGFRNLQVWDASFLAANQKGDFQPMVWDQNRFFLYAPSGDGWRRVGQSLAGNDNLQGQATYSPEQGIRLPFLIYGDTVWQPAVQEFPSTKAKVVSNFGETITLDTNVYFTPRAFLNGTDANLVVGRVTPIIDGHSTYYRNNQLVCYRWNKSLGKGATSKTILLDSTVGYSLSVNRVLGETRLYVPLNNADSAAVFALRGNALTRLEDVSYRNSDSTLPDSRWGFSNSIAGPDGCFHGLNRVVDTSTPANADIPRILYVHTSSCRVGGDTLKLPLDSASKSGIEFHPMLRFSQDGNPMVLYLTDQNAGGYFLSDAVIGPSRIFLARLTSERKWTWDTVAVFSGL